MICRRKNLFPRKKALVHSAYVFREMLDFGGYVLYPTSLQAWHTCGTQCLDFKTKKFSYRRNPAVVDQMQAWSFCGARRLLHSSLQKFSKIWFLSKVSGERDTDRLLPRNTLTV